MIFNVIKPIIESGVHLEDLAELIYWRKNVLFYKFDEELDEESVVERLMQETPGGKVKKHRRFFSKEDEIFHVDGKTYLLTNQWGKRALEAVEVLRDNYPELSISVTPVLG